MWGWLGQFNGRKRSKSDGNGRIGAQKSRKMFSGLKSYSSCFWEQLDSSQRSQFVGCDFLLCMLAHLCIHPTGTYFAFHTPQL
jgi:hypothetical protein